MQNILEVPQTTRRITEVQVQTRNPVANMPLRFTVSATPITTVYNEA